jgi:hypothetical protein
VQVHHIKTRVESAYGFQRLKLQYDEPRSNLAFKIYLRRYTTVHSFSSFGAALVPDLDGDGQGLTVVPISAQHELFRPPYNLT